MTNPTPPRANPGENAPETPQPVECQQVGLARPGEVVPHYQWTNGEVLTLRAEVAKLTAQKSDLKKTLRLATREIVHLKQIITNMEENL